MSLILASSADTLSVQLQGMLASAGIVVFYLLVWGLVFVGTGLFVGAFIPFLTGDTLLFAAGIATHAVPQLNIVLLAAGSGLAAFAGDQFGYYCGQRLGRPYLDRRARPWMQRIIRRVDNFYLRYGWWSVVIARFIPWARVFIPWIAGISKMSWLRFASSNLLGAVLWGAALPVSGYYAASIPAVRVAVYAIAWAVIGLGLVLSFRTWWLVRAERRAGHS